MRVDVWVFFDSEEHSFFAEVRKDFFRSGSFGGIKAGEVAEGGIEFRFIIKRSNRNQAVGLAHDMIDIATPGCDMNNASTFARDDIGVAFDIATAIDHAMAGNATAI